VSSVLSAQAPLLVGFLLVFFRTAALCAVAPLFGTRSLPPQVRLAFALVVALPAFAAAGAPAFSAWGQPAALVVTAAAEVLVGLAAGLAARFAVEAASAAGQAIGLGMGIGFGAVIDPINGADSTALGELLGLLALGTAVGLGLHREAIAWLCHSVAARPPGHPLSLPDLAAKVAVEAIEAASLAIRLAMPVLAAITLGYAALGIMSRTVPQLGQANLGFAVAIVAGGGALYLVTPALAESAASAARAAIARL